MDSGTGIRIAAASQGSQPATPRVRWMQITALTLLVTSGAVNYVDRARLAIGNPLIRAPEIRLASIMMMLATMENLLLIHARPKLSVRSRAFSAE